VTHWNREMSEAERAAVHAAGVPTSAAHPHEWWIAAIDVHSVGVTEEELRQLRSFIEHEVRHVYNDTWTERILSAALPKCGGHNTIVFLKRADGGWAYRRASWEIGPMYVPTWDTAPVSLVAAMDRVERGSPKWAEWKREHPNWFCAEDAA
jgi:hypothetical protein